MLIEQANREGKTDDSVEKEGQMESCPCFTLGR